MELGIVILLVGWIIQTIVVLCVWAEVGNLGRDIKDVKDEMSALQAWVGEVMKKQAEIEEREEAGR